MSYRAWFDGLSPLRRLALWTAFVSWVIWVAWLRFAFSEATIVRWSQLAVVAFVLVGATASAVVILEMVRLFLRGQWSETRHFTVLVALAAFLFAVQYSGVRLMLQAYAQ